jgi:hypothetical protein
VAYDIVLEVAMKAQHIQQRNLVVHGSWKWLLTEFALYYAKELFHLYIVLWVENKRRMLLKNCRLDKVGAKFLFAEHRFLTS